MRHWCSPCQVARNTSVIESFLQPGLRNVEAVGGPASAYRVDPPGKSRFKRGQVKVEVTCCARHGQCSTQFALWVAKLCSIVKQSTRVTLISAGVGSVAARSWTNTFHLTICQEFLQMKTMQFVTQKTAWMKNSIVCFIPDMSRKTIDLAPFPWSNLFCKA